MPHYLFHRYLNLMRRQEMAGEPNYPESTLLGNILESESQGQSGKERDNEPSILRNILKFGRKVAYLLMTAESSDSDDYAKKGESGDMVSSTSTFVTRRIFKPKKKRKKPKLITILETTAGYHQSGRRLRKRKRNAVNVTSTQNKKGGGLGKISSTIQGLKVIRPKTRKCPICNLTCYTWHGMRRHCAMHTKPAKCAVCGKLFHKWEHLRQHESHHFPYHCNLCPKRFIIRAGLNMHTEDFHDQEKNLKTPLFDVTPKLAVKPGLQLCKAEEEPPEQVQPLNLSKRKYKDN
ncbi:putative zinc finger protein, partial [Orchesella cincta]